MAVDKNLFLYDLAAVAIMYNESLYVKEWLDYHLLAGVEHFYIYDHESTDNFKEVLQPYIDAGIVTYTFYPGKAVQTVVYNDAVRKYRYLCRYMAFIDTDEFIFPQNNKSIVEVTDEIFKDNPKAAGLAVHWQFYGSNNLETADYSKGVLERFTRCEGKFYTLTKTINNPRKIICMINPHMAAFVEGYVTVNERGETVQEAHNEPTIGDKICINHYHCKSREEYLIKIQRGRADVPCGGYTMKQFDYFDRNDVFNDSILKYRDARKSILFPQSENEYDFFESLAASKQIDYQKLSAALLKNLAPIFSENLPKDFFVNKMETFLVCRTVSEYLCEKISYNQEVTLIEETALQAIYKNLSASISMEDLQLLFSELPNILRRNYPVVDEIRKICINSIPQLMHTYNLRNDWTEFTTLGYLMEMLKTFDVYQHK